MPWAKLKPFVSNLFRGKQPFDRRQIAQRTENQTLHSRRQLLTGLGMAGVCAVAAPSLLLNSANAATVIGSGAANLSGRGQSDLDEFEHADLNETDLDEAELIETDLDEADLDDAEIINVQDRRRGRRGRRRSSGRGRRRARSSRRRARRSRPRRARPRARARPRRRARPRAYYGRRRRRRRSYLPHELRYLCRNYYFRRDFPLLCAGVHWWL
jgi:hypothetical protein